MKENKSKVLSLRVTQDQYDTLALLSMINDISINDLLRGLLSTFTEFSFETQSNFVKLIIEKITKNKLN